MTSDPVECDVWWAGPAMAGPALMPLLDERERARHARFRRREDRDRYVVAHALARLAVAAAADCRPGEVAFDLECPHCAGGGEPHGKPRPAGAAAGVEMSISHSGDRVAVAVSAGVPVGVDVERVAPGRDTAGLAAMALTASERTDLDRLPPGRAARAFFDYWARKEALLKASGEGVYAGLTALSVAPLDEPPGVLSWTSPGAPPLDRVRLVPLDCGPDHRAALAALTPAPVAVRERDAAPLLAAHPTAVR